MKKETKKKILQAANLSPSEYWIEKIVEVHPMRQVTIMSVVQFSVFMFMLLSFKIISFLF